jgi:hypothetical protein
VTSKAFRIAITVIAILTGCFAFEQTIAASAAGGSSADLPVPPNGLHWYRSKKGVGTFLSPEGWFTREETKGDTGALFITREDISVNGRFTTGLTVNQFRNYSKNNSLKPSQYARQFIGQVVKGSEVITSGVVRGNKADLNIARVRGNNSGVSTIVHYIALGDDNKDQVYLIIFEVPEAQLEAILPLMNPMLNVFGLGE